ncbi:HNH endonuclease family protein [Corynebacterium kutscheri]|uniref:HNH endonuclease family protein n=1 Tax=Corynebacterium kutscheri TaxID=35755 RepID=UPI0037C0FD4A
MKQPRIFFGLVCATLIICMYHYTPIGTLPALNTVPTISQRAHVLGYKRTEFGTGWSTPAGQLCSIRIIIIATQLTNEPPGSDCQIIDSTGVDPYTGQPLRTTDAIEIDHIFPLSAAWDMGAYAWTQQQRQNFANDPLNLVAVSRSANQQKSDQLPALWLPKNRSIRCWYVTQLAEVAAKYDLSLPKEDKKIMNRQCHIPRFIR